MLPFAFVGALLVLICFENEHVTTDLFCSEDESQCIIFCEQNISMNVVDEENAMDEVNEERVQSDFVSFLVFFLFALCTFSCARQRHFHF